MDQLRAAFPVLERVAFLNTGTNGPVPAAAVAAARAELERQAAEGRSYANFERRGQLCDRQRTAYAALLGCEAADVALTTSTSEGIGRVLVGLGLRAGDEVVTSDEEHPGVLGPLQAARDLLGVQVREVPWHEVASAVNSSRTRAVVCSHVSWATGALAPAQLAEVEVPVVLDGAQGVGAVPVDVTSLGCDVYAGSGQKWLCGPDGSGMLYVAPGMRERLGSPAPTYLSFEDPNSGLAARLHPDARRYDTSALSAEGSAFAVAALDVLDEAGWPAIHARARDLAAGLAAELETRGFEVAARGPTTLVSWRSDDAEAERNRLATAGVVIRDLPGRGMLRASVGAWNNEEDVERLVTELGEPTPTP